MRIEAGDGSETLMRVIKNPITDHLPLDCRKIGTSAHARVVNMDEYIKTLPENAPVCFVFGAIAHGSVSCKFQYRFRQATHSQLFELNLSLTCLDDY
jgi:rRNA small subunit pseudouridine methyltransferase Nep1